MLFCSPKNEHLMSSLCANFLDSQKADAFSQFIERMFSYVALGCSPLRWNNCSSPNFNAINLFRNWAVAGWIVLQNVPLLGLEQESTIPAQWVRTSTSTWSIRNHTSTAGAELQGSEWGFIYTIAAPQYSFITPRRDNLACVPGTVCSCLTYS